MYDATGEWAATFSAYPEAGVTKLTVAGDEYSTQVSIVRDSAPEARYLIYLAQARPADADNWLLDLLRQGYEYKAYKASLALQEVGLPPAFTHLAEDHSRSGGKILREQFPAPTGGPLERPGARHGVVGMPGVLAQRSFFEHHVRPFLAKGQKVFVIISDALRYEAAAEFA